MRREYRERFPRHRGGSDPDMHHGTCVTHVPWWMTGSLTSGFLWSRWRGKHSRYYRHMRNLQFYVSGKSPIGSGLVWVCKHPGANLHSLDGPTCDRCDNTSGVVAPLTVYPVMWQCRVLASSVWCCDSGVWTSDGWGWGCDCGCGCAWCGRGCECGVRVLLMPWHGLVCRYRIE